MVKGILEIIYRDKEINLKKIAKELQVDIEIIIEMKKVLISKGYILEESRCTIDSCKSCSCGCSSISVSTNIVKLTSKALKTIGKEK